MSFLFTCFIDYYFIKWGSAAAAKRMKQQTRQVRRSIAFFTHTLCRFILQSGVATCVNETAAKLRVITRDKAALPKKERSHEEWISIVEELLASGASQRNIARASGISQRTLSRWKKDLAVKGIMQHDYTAIEEWVKAKRQLRIMPGSAIVPPVPGSASVPLITALSEDGPELNDPILVMTREYLVRIVRGEKTLEIRHMNLAPKIRYLACEGKVQAKAEFGAAIPITSAKQWKNLYPQHLVKGEEPPYETTFALPILAFAGLKRAVPYRQKRAARGTLRFVPDTGKSRQAILGVEHYCPSDESEFSIPPD